MLPAGQVEAWTDQPKDPALRTDEREFRGRCLVEIKLKEAKMVRSERCMTAKTNSVEKNVTSKDDLLQKNV